MCFIDYCIVKVGSDRADRSHTARRPRLAEYLPNVVTADDRDARRPGCARARFARRRYSQWRYDDLYPTVHVSN